MSQGFSAGHQSIDLAANSGTPIYSPDTGIVVGVNNNPNSYFGGNYIKVKGVSGYTFYMGHNSKNYFKVGDAVTEGQHIADVGSTGQATGPHIHFEMIGNSGNVDARKYLKYHPTGSGEKEVPITKEQENAMSVLATGSFPGKGYSYPNVGKPNNQQTVDAMVNQWLNFSENQPGGLIKTYKQVENEKTQLTKALNDANKENQELKKQLAEKPVSGGYTEKDRETAQDTNAIVKWIKDILDRIFK